MAGTVANVTTGALPDTVLVGINLDGNRLRFVFCTFSADSKADELLKKGLETKLVGRLAKVTALGVELNECRLD